MSAEERAVRASVVVPSRGGAARLPRLLGALAAQTHPDLEVVLVLDGDVDGSEEIARSWAERLDLVVVVFPENRGRSAALNAGHAAATGDVLVRCDDDLAPAPDHVARRVAHHAGGPVGVIGVCRNVYAPTPYAAAYGRPRDEALRAGAYAAPPAERWRYWGGYVSLDRATWEAVGDYDEGFRGYGLEDVDLGYRLHRLGIPIVVDPALEIEHHVAATSTEARVARAHASGASRPAFAARHGAEVLVPTSTTRSSWDRVVAGAARLRLPQLRRLARGVDAVLPLLPPVAAEKAVALLVEAAAVSGETHPADKDLDL